MEKDFLNTAFTTGQILNYKEAFGSSRNLQIADAQNHSKVCGGTGESQEKLWQYNEAHHNCIERVLCRQVWASHC